MSNHIFPTLILLYLSHFIPSSIWSQEQLERYYLDQFKENIVQIHSSLNDKDGMGLIIGEDSSNFYILLPSHIFPENIVQGKNIAFAKLRDSTNQQIDDIKKWRAKETKNCSIDYYKTEISISAVNKRINKLKRKIFILNRKIKKKRKETKRDKYRSKRLIIQNDIQSNKLTKSNLVKEKKILGQKAASCREEIKNNAYDQIEQKEQEFKKKKQSIQSHLKLNDDKVKRALRKTSISFHADQINGTKNDDLNIIEEDLAIMKLHKPDYLPKWTKLCLANDRMIKSGTELHFVGPSFYPTSDATKGVLNQINPTEITSSIDIYLTGNYPDIDESFSGSTLLVGYGFIGMIRSTSARNSDMYKLNIIKESIRSYSFPDSWKKDSIWSLQLIPDKQLWDKVKNLLEIGTLDHDQGESCIEQYHKTEIANDYDSGIRYKKEAIRKFTVANEMITKFVLSTGEDRENIETQHILNEQLDLYADHIGNQAIVDLLSVKQVADSLSPDEEISLKLAMDSVLLKTQVSSIQETNDVKNWKFGDYIADQELQFELKERIEQKIIHVPVLAIMFKEDLITLRSGECTYKQLSIIQNKLLGLQAGKEFTIKEEVKDTFVTITDSNKDLGIIEPSNTKSSDISRKTLRIELGNYSPGEYSNIQKNNELIEILSLLNLDEKQIYNIHCIGYADAIPTTNTFVYDPLDNKPFHGIENIQADFLNHISIDQNRDYINIDSFHNNQIDNTDLAFLRALNTQLIISKKLNLTDDCWQFHVVHNDKDIGEALRKSIINIYFLNDPELDLNTLPKLEYLKLYYP